MRTFEEIKSEIIAEKETRLPEITSTSATAVFMIWVNIVALAIFTFEQIFEKDKKALIDLTERRRFGTVDWYASEVKKFQFGHQLVFNSTTGQFYYQIDDETARVVVQSAVDEDATSGMLTIKVARLDNGELAPLLPEQLLALKSYLEEIKVAGTNIDLFSLNADVIDITAEIFYDGNLLQSDVETAINTALLAFKQNATFNGVVLKNDLIEVIRNVNGVDDVYFSALTGKTSIGSPTAIVRHYDTLSGYFVYATDFMNSWTFTPRHT
ncbi:MAG TPA: hypothetical protein PLP27_03815 [Crocinitomicaceae bacterium]|nr:hypothetical protein [Crocinitomicaceae bacterium]